MTRGDMKSEVIGGMKRMHEKFHLFTAASLSAETGYTVKQLSNYLLLAQKQGILERDGDAYRLVKNPDELVLTKPAKPKPKKPVTLKPLPKIDLKSAQEKVDTLLDYVKYLEDELIKERQDHSDLRSWVDRTLKKVPNPGCYRVTTY